MGVHVFTEMVGVEMEGVSVNKSNDELVFRARDGREFRFFHYQDCCESVRIEDVVGEPRRPKPQREPSGEAGDWPEWPE